MALLELSSLSVRPLAGGVGRGSILLTVATALGAAASMTASVAVVAVCPMACIWFCNDATTQRSSATHCTKDSTTARSLDTSGSVILNTYMTTGQSGKLEPRYTYGLKKETDGQETERADPHEYQPAACMADLPPRSDPAAPSLPDEPSEGSRQP